MQSSQHRNSHALVPPLDAHLPHYESISRALSQDLPSFRRFLSALSKIKTIWHMILHLMRLYAISSPDTK